MLYSYCAHRKFDRLHIVSANSDIAAHYSDAWLDKVLYGWEIFGEDPNEDKIVVMTYYAFMHDDGAIGGYAIIYSAGTNSYGGTVSDYFVYALGKDDREWNYIGSADVTYDEDDDDLADALTKIVIREGKEKGEKLSTEPVDRINTQFEAETLYKVEAIDWDVVDTSEFK